MTTRQEEVEDIDENDESQHDESQALYGRVLENIYSDNIMHNNRLPKSSSLVLQLSTCSCPLWQ